MDPRIIYFNLTLKAGSPYTIFLTGGHSVYPALLLVTEK